MAAFQADGGYMPTDDAVSLEAGGAYLIDVLANDIGLPEGAGDRMLILVNPACGVAAREEGMISYAVDPSCSGEMSLTYCVPSGSVCPSATLTITVIPAPGAAPAEDQGSRVSAADPTLSGGRATREFGAESSTPRIAPDDSGFGSALPPMGGGLGAVGAVDPSQSGGAPATGAAPAGPGQIARGGLPDEGAGEDEAAMPGFGVIQAVTGPSQRKKRKPRSVYASPDIDALSAARPQRPGGDVAAVQAPQAASAERLATAPPERVRLARAEAADRAGPIQPEPILSTPSPRVLRAQPRIGAAEALTWGALADRDAGAPSAPFISPLAEFRELVSLGPAPQPERALPEPRALARVAALSGLQDGWVKTLLLEDAPAAAPAASLEPLAELVDALGPLEPPAGFYAMVSLDPHARHRRLEEGRISPAPEQPAPPAAQLQEKSEPAPEPLRRIPGEVASLTQADPQEASPRELPGHARPVSLAAAAPPLPFTEREEGPVPQAAEKSEPLPPALTGFASDAPTRVAALAPRGDRPAGVAFRAGAVGALAPARLGLSLDLGAVTIPALERTEPLPPALTGWAPKADEMPVMRVSVNLTISGAREMPVRVRRSFQTLTVVAAQAPRLVLLDQAPTDANASDRTEPLPLNLRRVRSFPPLLSQRVRMTPDFYGVGLPRLGFRVRRYAELAPLGVSARPFAAFEPDMPPRNRASDPNPPTRAEAIAASIAAGLGPFVGPDPQSPRRPFEAAPAPAAGAWPETGGRAPLVLAAATAPEIRAPEQARPSMVLAALTSQEPAAPAPETPASLTADAGPAPDCPMELTAFPAAGGLIQFQVISPCRANRVGVLHLGELRIALRFDPDGEVNAMIPGVARDSRLRFVATDGAAVEQPITILDIGGVNRVAVVWDEPVDINLHAFEFGAGAEDKGHLWAGAKPNARGYRRGRNGLVSAFPAIDGHGVSVEFYSFNPGRRSPSGRIALAVEFASRGATPQAPYCDGDLLASPSFRIHRFNNGTMDGGAARIFQATPCGVPLEAANIYLRDLVPDFLVLNR